MLHLIDMVLKRRVTLSRALAEDSMSQVMVHISLDETWVESQASEFQFEVEHMFPRLILEQDGAIVGFKDRDSVGDHPR